MAVHAGRWVRPVARAASGSTCRADARPRTARRRLRCTTLVLLACVGPLVLASEAPSSRAETVGMARIRVHGSRLYAGRRPWRAWGMNWGIGNHAPVIAYFENPTAAKLAVLRGELRVARSMGANSMRIYLQLGQVMASPTGLRQRTLTALKRLLALAQVDQIYLDITGDLVWQPSRAPAWYDRMSWRMRWRVQARFWKAVAHTAAASPAVLCYELTSEPIVSQTPGYYYGQIGKWYFVQSIATAPAEQADRLARAWTRSMAGAVRSEDHRPVTIGLLPFTAGPFAPSNIAPLLDLLTIHEYPSTGQAASAVARIKSYAACHKPVLLGETFQLSDPTTQRQFLIAAAPDLSGAFEFFDGQDPRTMHPHTAADIIYKQSLQQFIGLRHLLTAT